MAARQILENLQFGNMELNWKKRPIQQQNHLRNLKPIL